MKMLQNQALLDDIENCELEPEQCAFWWLGQQSFILKMANTVIYLDPYLSPSERRNTAPLLTFDEVRADVVTGSHLHTDHIDLPLWQELVPSRLKTTFLLPSEVQGKVTEATGVPAARLTAMNVGDTVACGSVEITAIPAAHEFLDRDAVTGGYPYLGFIIRGGGCTVYHAGDTCLYEGLQHRLQEAAPDLVLLPINGRDAVRYQRGCIGNMTYQEAADLAGPLRPKLTVPAHFDMFDGNTENPQLFVDYMAVKYPECATMIPLHGRRAIVDCK